ncbi:unnamed protein product [Sphagnum compactum]
MKKREGLSDSQCTGQRLRNRLKLAVIATAEREVQKHEMQISPHVMTALADLTFKYAEELAKDVELFAHHAGRKSVMVDDVLLAAHRNEDVVAKLRAFAQSLTKSREHQPEKKRKRAPTKEPDACA